MPLPSTTYSTIQQLLNDINTRFVPNGAELITGDIGNSQLNGLANFIVEYTLNSGLAGISSSTGVISLSKPITVFTIVPTSINWPDNIQNEYYIINATGSVIPLTSGYSYIDQHQVSQTSIPARSSIHIVKATNGSWILANNLGGSGGGGVTSVGLVMPFGFTVNNSPITGDGTIVVTAANEWVSVTDYGATGNGTTDDTANIQAALDSGAKTILFPQGTYLITSILKVNSNTTIIGYGATLFRGSSMNSMMQNNSNGTIGGYDANENIEIYGLSFNGNKATFPTNSTLVAIGHAKKIMVKDCKFYNIPGAWHGIELNGVRDAVVDGCHFYSGGTSEQLQLDLMANSGVFPWFGPYDNTYCENIVINGNLISDAGGGIGSHNGGNPNQNRNVVISNNALRNLTNDAINGWNHKNLVIIGNTIDGCNNGIVGFAINAGVQNWTISNNTISNATSGGINVFGVKGLSIVGNTINTTTAWGIFIGNSDSLIITGNNLKNIARSTVTDYAAIDIAACTNVYVANNVAFKDSTALSSGTNTIKTSTSPFGGSVNTNITIENNTVSTPATTTTFNFAGTNTNFIVGNNIINNKVTPFISTKTANYTYTPTDAALNVDTTAGNVTITINPAIFNKAGLIVIKTTSDANTVTIIPSSGTINGAVSITLSVLNQSSFIKSDWINLSATNSTDSSGAIFITSADFDPDGVTYINTDLVNNTFLLFWNDLPRFIYNSDQNPGQIEWQYQSGGGFKILIPGFDANTTDYYLCLFLKGLN